MIRKTLRYLGVPQSHLSIVFITDQQIRRLNQKFLGCDRPTDVLAFDLGGEPDVSKTRTKRREALRRRWGREGVEGEIIISATTAYRNARYYGTSPDRELMLYLVHGILHLLGYDDHAAPDTKRMRRKEQEVMDFLAGKECSARERQ